MKNIYFFLPSQRLTFFNLITKYFYKVYIFFNDLFSTFWSGEGENIPIAIVRRESKVLK